MGTGQGTGSGGGSSSSSRDAATQTEDEAEALRAELKRLHQLRDELQATTRSMPKNTQNRVELLKVATAKGDDT